MSQANRQKEREKARMKQEETDKVSPRFLNPPTLNRKKADASTPSVTTRRPSSPCWQRPKEYHLSARVLFEVDTLGHALGFIVRVWGLGPRGVQSFTVKRRLMGVEQAKDM